MAPDTSSPRLALYESALAINTNGYIFVGAGGVYRSTDYGDSWAEINHDMIQTDVRALVTNPSGHIFAGTYFGRRRFPIDRQWRQLEAGKQRVWTVATFGLSRLIRSALSSPKQQEVEQECIAPLTTATVGRLPT